MSYLAGDYLTTTVWPDNIHTVCSVCKYLANYWESSVMISEVQTQKPPADASGFPILGNLPELARGPIQFLTRLLKDYGDVASFSLMGEKGVVLGNPQDIDRVLLETGKRYGKFKPSFALRTVLGNGLVTSEG